ncbi:MucB/RseB C-terminal domain-containing protein [Orbus hercynius]|nr:MucB/RseB C-terminal domain-containing protein [Orbus hercynius]
MNLFKMALVNLCTKQLKIILTILSLFLCCSVFATTKDKVPVTNAALTDDSVIAILNNMQHAVLNTDYQIYFVLGDNNDYATTFQYTYMTANKQNYAQLLYLEGAAKEIILHNNTVSYFQPESVSFSFPASRILEAFPDVIYNDFKKLSKYYDFILLGKARTADEDCQLIRIIPKDKDRYNYVIWIDDKSHLPLRIDLLDFNSKIIKQMKVLDINFAFDKTAFKKDIEQRNYPIFFPLDKEESALDSWSVKWLPAGFEESASYNINYEKSTIDTRLFSDGIFSFSVNVSAPASLDKKAIASIQSDRTVYSANIDNKNVVIIGNIPLETIERIAHSIKSK